MIIRGMNLINPFSDIASLPTISLPNIGGGGGGDFAGVSERAGMPQISAAMPAMPAPAAPLAVISGGGSRSQGPSFSGGSTTFDTQGQIGNFGLNNLPANFTINVSGGISTSAEIGKSVVDAITQYTQVYGPVRFATA